MEIIVDTKIEDRIGIVEVHGEIDTYTSPKIREEINDLIEKGCNNLIVDLTDVRYMDSTGLGVLIGALKRVKEKGGCINIATTDFLILRAFKVTGLKRIFGIFDSVEKAKTAIEKEIAAKTPV